MASVIEQSTYFTSLPRSYYFSQELYERELRAIYGRQWLYFGHASQLPETGDYLTRELGGESVVVVRDEHGELHGFLNVCRHRGSRLCDEPRGHLRKRIVCPYHQWSYGLDGALLNAPTIPDGEQIDYGDWGLHRVHVETWRGFVFVCLAVEAPAPLAPRIEEAAPELARIEPEALKEAHVATYDLDVNWKVLLENFLECYHCRATHPELCVAMDLHAPRADAIGSGDVSGQAELWRAGLPLRPGMKTLSIDGELVSRKLLGEFGRGAEPPADAFSFGFLTQPAMTSMLFHVDHGVVHEFLPIALDRVRFVNRWFVRADAEEGRDYELDALTKVWDVTNEQDKALCERVQAGIRSRRYVPGPMSASAEPGVRFVLATYLRMLEDDAASL